MRGPKIPDRPAVPQSRALASARSWRQCRDFAGERHDFACSRAGVIQLGDQAARLRGIGKRHALPDANGEHWRLMLGQHLGRLAGDDGAGGAAIEHETRDELWAEDARFLDQLQHLGGGPSIERRWLDRYQHEVGRQQGRAQQARDTRGSINDHVIGVTGRLRGFTVQRVARQADDAE